MKKVLIHSFDPVIYPFKFWIVVNKTPNILSDTFKEYNGSPLIFVDGETDRTEAFVLKVIHKDTIQYGAVLYFRSKQSMTYNLVAHEASHAAKFLFEHINADISEHEPFEYVLGFIADCCYQVKTNKFK